MNISEENKILYAVTAYDLKQFGNYLIKESKKEFEKQNSQRENEKYYNPSEVAKILGVDRSTLWRWHKKGYLCHNEVGGKRKYRMSEVNAILKGGK